MNILVFLLLSALLIVGAVSVIMQPSPIRSALSLVCVLFFMAVMFLFLDAQLVAMLQVIVYTGAIMVLFLFVLMLLNLQEDRQVMTRLGTRIAAGGVGALFALSAIRVFLRAEPSSNVPRSIGMDSVVAADFGSTELLARQLFTQYIFAFEVTGVLLLVAVIGAVVMAKKELT